ncbi:hypothetical protein NW754_012663 [Fusarium falciforme]|uniref:Elongin-A n=1 Tax=Fusarium falciforme TaxID=195108 RepID=A0A9W8V7J2_9HYPO|nr:Hypothetical protein NCS54_00073700 [Fusarium falciforme]KAJ4173666.1 hypothetical protein NW754_012663 [Fusarium falciforme]KAJ4196651.1 hypothetical protein NW755_001429 [Fusarium falciforme]KAJ4259058.1 hypothetical protein NW757_002392 [Fusarium falciforme]WAO83544.1 Hypothetical protein NCS54_00073700 [Fusarium falciforme]
MPPKSLMELATLACIKNIRELEGVGYLPYDTVRPILLRIDNAHQLRKIELNSPQVEGETGEIWLKIIEREFPMEVKAKAYKPQNPKSWFRVWKKYKKDHDNALQESEAKLMNALAGLRQDKEKNTSKIVDRRLLPGLAAKIGPRRPWGQRDSSSSTFTFNKGSRTKTKTGAQTMRKIRRETQEISNIHRKLSRPTAASNAITALRRAPAAMVNDERRATLPSLIKTPKASEPSEAMLAHEQRATFISDSESDQGDDLFDEDEEDEPEPVPRKPAPKSFAKSSATSLLKKRPGSSSGVLRTSTAPTKRPGILSNSYKGPKTSTTTSSAPAPSKPRPEPPMPSQRPPRTQSSPPPSADPGPSSSPPARAPLPMPRKRKAVDVFMKPKKRA